jgi:hypothetical protein
MGPIQQKQISQLDSVQRRAARFVSNNFQDREPLFETNRAALRCTESSWDICFC